MNDNEQKGKKLLSVSETAKELGLSRSTIDNLIKRGSLEVVRYEGVYKRLVTIESIEKFKSN